ncbi:MAG: ribonuclease E/G [Rhodobacteraceae bacterium]|nr:ribonuclease E/G [Paracoccaceae bacterium]MCY4327708.1 ribonuclease E/G [Paracoccaceae bacterium]
MLIRRIVQTRLDNRQAVAVITDGVLDDFVFQPPASEIEPGTILSGIVERALSSQGAWIVRLGKQRRGFLRCASPLREGEPLRVQVSGYADQGKLIPLTTRLEIRGRYLVATNSRRAVTISGKINDPEARERIRQRVQRATTHHDDALGFIVRSSAMFASDRQLTDDLDRLSRDYGQIMKQGPGDQFTILGFPPSILDRMIANWGDTASLDIVSGGDTFDQESIFEMLEPFINRKAPLSNGGNLVVEPTHAFVAIDVNSGRDLSGKSGLHTNLAAARELPRHMRIRGLGGQIVIDFVPLTDRGRQQVEDTLRQAFLADRVATTLVGWTRLGHYEIHRHRERYPLCRWLEE